MSNQSKGPKILHVILGDLTGGAARGAYWLHRGLLEQGVNSTVLNDGRTVLNDSTVYYLDSSIRFRIIRYFAIKLNAFLLRFYPHRLGYLFSTNFFGISLLDHPAYKAADIINLHWVGNGGGISLNTISSIKKPLVWTLRDMWPMTGGCHYAIECSRFREGCGYCPQLGSRFRYDLSWIVLRIKRLLFPKKMHIIGISDWTSKLARSSQLFGELEVRTISNGVDLESFFPIEKKTIREKLKIRTTKKIVVVGAQNVSDFYKGFFKFKEATKYLDRENYFLCFFGAIDEREIVDLGFEFKSFGFIAENELLRSIYSAGDVFVSPSIMETFGKTLVESMACGTPVVCFDATGPAEIVVHKETGYKARPFLSESLAEGVRWVCKYSEDEGLGDKARKRAVEKFSLPVSSKQYSDLYQEILKNNKDQ